MPDEDQEQLQPPQRQTQPGIEQEMTPTPDATRPQHQGSGKLAGALHARRDLDDDYHRGYILAITKRCLNWANEAFAALNDLLIREDYAAHRPLFENWREGLFELRQGITVLRDEMREE